MSTSVGESKSDQAEHVESRARNSNSIVANSSQARKTGNLPSRNDPNSFHSKIGKKFELFYDEHFPWQARDQANIPVIDVAFKINKITSVNAQESTFDVVFTLMLDWLDLSVLALVGKAEALKDINERYSDFKYIFSPEEIEEAEKRTPEAREEQMGTFPRQRVFASSLLPQSNEASKDSHSSTGEIDIMENHFVPLFEFLHVKESEQIMESKPRIKGTSGRVTWTQKWRCTFLQKMSFHRL